MAGACWADMVVVPAGPFVRGCSLDGAAPDPGCVDAYHPLEQVSLPAFEIDTTEVPRWAYAECQGAVEQACDVRVCGSGGDDVYDPPDLATEHPAECTTREQAVRYCAWAGKRLCSEDEWTKAARGVDGHLFPWGDDPPGTVHANCRPADGQPAEDPSCRDLYPDTTAPVGSFVAGESPFGALDLAGNVAEWVADDFAPELLTEATARGGTFDDEAFEQRAYHRWAQMSDTRSVVLGFRCCRDRL